MYAALGPTLGVTIAAVLVPPANAFLEAARLSLAVAGAVFALYSVVLLAVAVRASIAR